MDRIRWQRRKLHVLHRDGWRCQYCGVWMTRETATLDHLTPVAQGGSNLAWNLVACCLGCNQDKGDALPLEFLWVIGRRFTPGPAQSPAKRPPSPSQAYARTWHHPRLSVRPAS
ncbi:HNH endonuclease [Paludisphaera soli]|uniref:HNH endonuclease n=1 Tax=Paludisphaera soli TaxID=2712865 RepID=UPI0013EB6F1C|nr:HNH endonuclease [Paludisphaera soli]